MSALHSGPPDRTDETEPTRRRRTSDEAAERRLRLVDPAPVRMRRAPFLLVLAVVLGVGLVGLLVLNTSLQNQAFAARTLNRQASLLANQQAQLQSRVDQLRTPQTLADKAATLGMRPNPNPGFVTLPDGKIIGKPQKVTDSPLPPWLRSTAEDTAREQSVQKAAAKAAREQAAVAKAAKAKADAAAKAAREKAAREKAAADKAAADKAAQEKAAAEKKPAGGN